MKAAIITQPKDGIGENTSLGIITLALAQPLSKFCDVIVYGRKNPNISEPKCQSERLKFRYITLFPDDYITKAILKILKMIFPGRMKRMPIFAFQLHYIIFAAIIALDIRRQKCQVAHIHNYSQFVPVIRFFNPSIRIILHMNCEWLTQINKKVIEPRLRKADLILSCSDFVTNRNKLQFPALSNRFETLYNGVDTEVFQRQIKTDESTSSKKKRLLFVGRVSPEKGVHVLIEAFNLLASKYPDIELDIAGPLGASSYIIELDKEKIVQDLAHFYLGHNDYVQYVKDLIKPELKDKVRFHGAVDHSALVNFYNAADIFVFPSVWHEPFGIPVAEAMAAEVPVVTTKSGGITEIVENNKSGFTVERNDAIELFKSMEIFLLNNDLKMEFIRSGRQRAIDVFSWEKIAHELLKFYKADLKSNFNIKFISNAAKGNVITGQ